MAKTTMTTSPLDLEVTVVTKGTCPGVLDKPVWYTSFFSVSDSQNGMVIIVPEKFVNFTKLQFDEFLRVEYLHAVHVVDLITTLPIINDTSVVSTKTSGINGGGNRSMIDQ